MKIIGLDLAGLERRPTGYCLLTEKGPHTAILHTDREILAEIKKARPNLIAIDAPFGFPKTGWWRDSDRALRAAGFRPLSPKFPSMRALTRRAARLVKLLRARKYKVIEVFPRATEQVLCLERKAGNPHEWDALLCALTGRHYLEGRYQALGKEKVIVPKLK